MDNLSKRLALVNGPCGNTRDTTGGGIKMPISDRDTLAFYNQFKYFNQMVKQGRATNQPAFAAIADPTRREILDLMRGGEIGAGDLAKRFPISRPAISRHLRILQKAGLVRARKDAQRRFYSLRPQALAGVDQWLAPYRLFWAARMTDIKIAAETLAADDEAKTNDDNA